LTIVEKKIAILLVIDGLEFGGGERVFLQLVSGLKDRYRVSVATNTTGKFAQELNKLDIQIFSVDMSRQLSLRPIRQIRDIILQNRIALVHSQGARADFFARLAGRMANSPHILCTVAMPVEGFDVTPLRKQIYRFIDRFSENYVDRFLVVSDALKHFFTVERGISTERVVRIYNGIELYEYQPNLKGNNLRNEWGIPDAEPIVGAIGRLVWQKGFEHLIKAAPEILAAVPEAWFLLVGKGPLRPNLEALARELNISERIIFTGFRSDIKEILSTIDILVIPSLLEGFPIITLEAMAMAKPIVATQLSGITEQISGDLEGILVPPKNPEALGAAVVSLLQDRKLASRLGAAARSRVEMCFSVEQMVRETEKVYLSVLRVNDDQRLSLLR
jgi:glycosyltransferase involved in cell wall biosynthesis